MDSGVLWWVRVDPEDRPHPLPFGICSPPPDYNSVGLLTGRKCALCIDASRSRPPTAALHYKLMHVSHEFIQGKFDPETCNILRLYPEPQEIMMPPRKVS